MELNKIEKSVYVTKNKEIIVYGDYKKRDGYFSKFVQSWSFTIRYEGQVRNCKGFGSKNQAFQSAKNNIHLTINNS